MEVFRLISFILSSVVNFLYFFMLYSNAKNLFYSF